MLSIRNCCHKIFGGRNDSALLSELKAEDDTSVATAASGLRTATGLTSTAQVTNLSNGPDPGVLRFVPGLHRKQSVPESASIRPLFPNEDFIALYEAFFAVYGQYATPEHRFRGREEGEVAAAEQFAANLPTVDGTNVNILIQRFKTKFSSQFCMFSTLNQLVNLFPNIEASEVVHYETHPDAIFLIERTRTKKVALFASRQTLTLRVVKMLDVHRYIDLSTSIQLTSLAQAPRLANILAGIPKDELATVFVAGNYFENKDGMCECVSLTKVNFLSSVSLKISAFFLNTKFAEYVKGMDQNLVRNSERSYPTGFEHTVWFKDPQADKEGEPEFARDRESMLASRVSGMASP